MLTLIWTAIYVKIICTFYLSIYLSIYLYIYIYISIYLSIYLMLIAIIDARSIANAYYYGDSYARPVCYECADLHPVSLKGNCHIFCSRKAVQSRIYKIAVRYDRQKNPILSVKINRNPSDPFFFFFFFFCFCFFQLMVYKYGRWCKNATQTDEVL